MYVYNIYNIYMYIYVCVTCIYIHIYDYMYLNNEMSLWNCDIFAPAKSSADFYFYLLYSYFYLLFLESIEDFQKVKTSQF